MYASPMEAAPRALGLAGLRRPSPAAQAALAAADHFAGLPEGVTRWRLTAALRAAARPLRLSSSMLALLEHYVDLTYDVDWTPGSEPLVIRPLIEVAEHFGKSERQIRNLERALAERGLLAWRDSGNHHRKGRRDRATGRILWGYGPSLAPLGRRAEEILRLAELARAELAELRRMRLAISALRRRVRESAALASPEAGAIMLAALAQLPDRNPAGASLVALKAQRDRLIVILDMLAPRLEAAEIPEEPAPEAEISVRHITVTRSEKSINGYCRSVEPINSTAGVERIAFGLVEMAAGPELRAAAAATGGGWSGLVGAAARIAPLFGVTPQAWGEACGALGRNTAALCLLLVERGLERNGENGPPPVERPSAYFDALIARGRDGRLRLDRSLFALARRSREFQIAGVTSGRPIEI